MKRPHSLKLRLVGAMLAVFALGLAASLASYRFAIHNIVSDLHVRTLQAQARELQASLDAGGVAGIEAHLPADWRRVYLDPSRQFSYTIFDAAHRPLAWSPNLAAPWAYVPASRSVVLAGAGSGARALYAEPVADGDEILVARSDLTRDTLIDSLFEETSEHLSVLAPFAALTLALTWLVSTWSLRPIERASREAASVGPGAAELRISEAGLPREIRPLVDAVNGALERLSRAYASERRLTADAAHELRTPLAVLTLRLERARLTGTTDWPAVERELRQMARLVDQLLDLARKESLARESPSSGMPVVNLSRIVREVAAALFPLMEASGRRIEVEAPDVAPVHGRTDDLRDSIRNLLDNALVHGRGTVTVAVQPSSAAPEPHWTVEVRDEGAGVPAGLEETVFERFRKLAADTPGSGLGLAIVRQVARSHGGDVRFLAGYGAVVLSLPAAPALAQNEH